jgi:hypothetical protein
MPAAIGARPSRRGILGFTASAALGVAFGMPSASCAGARTPADPGPFALGPKVGSNWATHQSESTAQLVQLPTGVGLQAGPMGAVDRNGLAIWSRSTWSEGNFQVSFKTRKLDANNGTGKESLFLLLYFGVQGKGTADYPVNLADWPGTTVPYTHAYAEHIRGARITFYYQPPGKNSETQTVSAACFNADGSRTSVKASSTVKFLQRRDVLYGWTVRRVGTVVTVTQNRAGAPRSVSFTSPAFAPGTTPEHFGLLVSPGRYVQVTDFSVTPL